MIIINLKSTTVREGIERNRFTVLKNKLSLYYFHNLGAVPGAGRRHLSHRRRRRVVAPLHDRVRIPNNNYYSHERNSAGWAVVFRMPLTQ